MMARHSIDTMEPTTSADLTERRYVYNGESSGSDAQNFAPRGNRPVKKRKRSPFNIIAVLFVVSILIVFYVWNKITVNRLAIEVNDLQNQFQKITSTNDVVRAEINKKSSLERIGKLAGQLGLISPKEQPAWFDVNSKQNDRLQSSNSQQ
jgi:cell division protein FtsL